MTLFFLGGDGAMLSFFIYFFVHMTQSVAEVKKSVPPFENHFAHVCVVLTTHPLAEAPDQTPFGAMPKLLQPWPVDVHRAAAAATAAAEPLLPSRGPQSVAFDMVGKHKSPPHCLCTLKASSPHLLLWQVYPSTSHRGSHGVGGGGGGGGGGIPWNDGQPHEFACEMLPTLGVMANDAGGAAPPAAEYTVTVAPAASSTSTAPSCRSFNGTPGGTVAKGLAMSVTIASGAPFSLVTLTNAVFPCFLDDETRNAPGPRSW